MAKEPTSTAPLALVTAGAKRLGRATCVRLANLGYDIALHYHHSHDEAAALRDELMQKGRRCDLFQGDLSKEEDIVALIPRVRADMGDLSLLVNSASVFEQNTLMNSTMDEFNRDFNLQVKAPFFLTQEFAKTCKADGQIINMVDTCITRQKTEYFTYLLSKKALLDLTKMSAHELAPRVRVNAIAPGLILPPPGVELNSYMPYLQNNLLRRAASADDIMHGLEYLLTSKQVTGECLFIDGGDSVSW